MKKIILSAVAFSLVLFANNTNAQSTISGTGPAGHLAFIGQQPTHYLGWQNNAIPLYFRTGFHGGTRNRMLIRQGGFGVAGGRVAMGNNLPNNFIPRSRLHLHQTAGVTDIRFSNNVTGSFTNDGLQIGINRGGNAWLRLWENRDMLFYTNNILRMKIFRGNNYNTPTKYDHCLS